MWSREGVCAWVWCGEGGEGMCVCVEWGGWGGCVCVCVEWGECVCVGVEWGECMCRKATYLQEVVSVWHESLHDASILPVPRPIIIHPEGGREVGGRGLREYINLIILFIYGMCVCVKFDANRM